MIYFNENKKAFSFEIPDYIATTSNNNWAQYAGKDNWDIIEGVFTDISSTPEYIEQQRANQVCCIHNKYKNIINNYIQAKVKRDMWQDEDYQSMLGDMCTEIEEVYE